MPGPEHAAVETQGAGDQQPDGVRQHQRTDGGAAGHVQRGRARGRIRPTGEHPGDSPSLISRTFKKTRVLFL